MKKNEPVIIVRHRKVRSDKSQKRKNYSEKSRLNLRPFKKGEPCANPGGKPKNDVAQQIARQIFENNPDAIYSAMAKQLIRKGDSSTFNALADRGYGKVPQKVTQDVNLDVASSGRLEALLSRAIAAGDQQDESK